MSKNFYDVNVEHKADFENYLTFVNSRAPLYCINSNKHQSQLRYIYKQIFSLMTFQTKVLQDMNSHLKESVLNLPIAFDLIATNNINSFRLMCRNVIEQFNRYLYSKLTNGQTETIRNMHFFIKEYFKKYKLIKHINILVSEYKNLCEYVHVTKNSHFLTHDALSEYYFDKRQFRKIANSIKLLERIVQSMIIILVTLETEAFLKLNRDNQKLIELSTKEKIEGFVILDNYYIPINSSTN